MYGPALLEEYLKQCHPAQFVNDDREPNDRYIEWKDGKGIRRSQVRQGSYLPDEVANK